MPVQCQWAVPVWPDACRVQVGINSMAGLVVLLHSPQAGNGASDGHTVTEVVVGDGDLYHTNFAWQVGPSCPSVLVLMRVGLVYAFVLPEVFNHQVRLHAQFRGQLPDKASQQELSPAGAAGPVPARSDVAAAAGSGGGAGSKRGPAAAVSAAKRRRWQQQVLDLMGCTDSAVGVGAQEVMDFLSASWSAPAALALQSVDGAVLAREVCVEAPQPAADSRGSRKPSVNVINSWVYACPLTGEMWMRNPTAAGVQ